MIFCSSIPDQASIFYNYTIVSSAMSIEAEFQLVRRKKKQFKPKSCQKDIDNHKSLILYHGTSWTCAKLIETSGFESSSSGELGAGIYFSTRKTAINYALAAQGRGKGFGAMIIKVRVDYQTLKTVSDTNDAGNWTDEYDGCYCPEMTATAGRTANKLTDSAEWVFKNPASITVLECIEIEPGNSYK